MEAASASAPQRVCPHCARLSYATGARCPYCRRGFRRRGLHAVAAMLAVTAALVLGGVYLMLIAFGDELDSELDRQVETVQGDLDRDLRDIQRDIRRELDRRLPAQPATPAP
jgi:cell division protein FtsX